MCNDSTKEIFLIKDVTETIVNAMTQGDCDEKECVSYIDERNCDFCKRNKLNEDLVGALRDRFEEKETP